MISNRSSADPAAAAADTHPTENVTTLDPEDWDAARRVGHRMVDVIVEHMATAAQRPAWRPVPQSVRDDLDGALPRQGRPLDEVCDQFERSILPYPTGNAHPRFFGWVMGNGTFEGALADLLAAGMNSHLAGYDQSAALIERRVIRWLIELVGYPETAGGLLVSGGTMANLNGLAVARHVGAGFDVRAQGIAAGPPLRVYASRETHSWLIKACELMGLGRQAIRWIDTDSRFRADVASCRQQIVADLERGERPFCVVATVGSVNTGAIDDLHGLREICDEHGLWLHVDGAFGALAAWSPDHRHLVEAQAFSDSIAFDLHKWGYLPYEVGCVLVRDQATQASAFEIAPPYLLPYDRGLSVDTTYFADRGLQLSRGFRALKVWMSLQHHGLDRIGSVIGRNIEQAKHLAKLVRAEPELELMAPVDLNVVCLRYRAAALNDDQLNRFNEELLLRLQESGRAVPSQTILESRFVIRVCITNHRTSWSDMDLLIDDLLQYGRALAAEARESGKLEETSP